MIIILNTLVADEVRKLAERTAIATTEITELVVVIQKESKEAAVLMQESAEEASLYAANSQESVGSMQGLAHLAQQMEASVTASAMLSYVELAAMEDSNQIVMTGLKDILSETRTLKLSLVA